MTVTLEVLIKFYQRKMRRHNSSANRKAIIFLKKVAGKWGRRTPIHDEPGVRSTVAECIAHRTGLPDKHVFRRMDTCAHYLKQYRKENP